ncbi:MAG TPA: glycosyl hydrolase family 65 protein [Phycisphaerae bacterium]|nr:glycosyl hydrolase family 65 protein [Phycisphaerae bacterium]
MTEPLDTSTVDTWAIVETDFDVRNNRHYEALMAIGSGPLQQRASLEGGLSDDPQDREYLHLPQGAGPPAGRRPHNSTSSKSRFGTFLPGVTGPHPTCGDEMINLPAIHGLTLYAGHERLDMERSRIEGYRRRLDLRTGRLSREFTWHTQRGGAVAVRFERFISAARRHVMALRCHLRHLSGPAVELRMVGTLDADVRTNGFDHFEHIALTGEHEPITIEVRTNGGDTVAAAALMTCEPGVVWTVETEPRWAGIGGMRLLEPGQQVTLCKYAVLISSRHVQGRPLDAARNLVWSAAGLGYERLAAESDAVWQRRWEQTDVVIEGDPRSQLALRCGLYHLMRAAGDGDTRLAIDPCAATNEACCGRFTWDTDVFMLPAFLYSRPEVGRTLAGFRLRSLPGARVNARRYGYSGARYAWESDPQGQEQCPAWQHADHDVHVSADVAYGLWHAYLANTSDVKFLAGVAEALTEIARFWLQRVTYNAARGEYELLMVTGPDQYTPFSRNNAYTNRLVACALNLAVTAWRELESRDRAAAVELSARLALQASELEQFTETAGKLRFPYDEARKLVVQCDGFFEQEPFELDRHWTDRARPLAASVPQERLFRSQVIKQADALQLIAVFPQEFAVEQMQAAFDTYAPLTAHDSSVSRGMFALVAAWLGRTDEALRLWGESASRNLDPPGAAEGVAAAAAGLNWQVVVFGFAGLRTLMQSQVLWIDPHLPRNWTALRFPFVWRGQPLFITIEQGRIRVEHRGDRPVDAQILGRPVRLEPGRRADF